MKIILNRIGALIVLVALVLSTTGISFYLHTCGCSHKEEISFVKAKSSCCSTEDTEEIGNLNQISKPSCCKDVHFFYKLPLTFVQTVFAFFTPVFDFALIFDSDLILNESLLSSNFPVFYHAPPPVFFGKHLVHFLQSLKIPFSVL